LLHPSSCASGPLRALWAPIPLTLKKGRKAQGALTTLHQNSRVQNIVP
jgi:hypothetical protein